MVGQEYLDTTMAYLVTKGLEDNFTKECSKEQKQTTICTYIFRPVCIIIKKIGTNWWCNLAQKIAYLK